MIDWSGRLRRVFDGDAVGWLVAPGLLLVAQQILWPAPAGAMLDGVILGLITALVALGIVLIYRSNRVLNFAQGELGLLPTTLAVMFVVESGFPYLVAFVLGLLIALTTGAAAEFVVVRRFFNSPRLILTIATIGLAQLLGFASLLVPRWWDARVSSQRIDSPLDITFDVGSFRFNGDDLIVLVVVPLVLAGTWFLLTHTRLGIAIRASAELPDRAGTLGIPVRAVQTVVWSLATGLAFLALWLRASVLGLPVGGALGLLFFLRSLAAAVMGRLSDLKAVLTGSLALGIVQSGIVWNSDSALEAEALMGAVTAVVILVALLARRRTFSRLDNATTALSMGETRPVPPELARRPEVRAVGLGLVVVGGALVAMVPVWFGTVTVLRFAALYLFTITVLSLVVLTGWAGQISLGQVALASCGSAVAAWMTINWSADLLVVTLVAGIVGAAISVLVGLPALRIRGLYLAVTTLAFAVAVSSYVLNTRFFDWLPDERVPRLPILGRVGYTSPTGIYWVSVVALALAFIAVRGIRRSRTGRVLLALRDNEAGTTAYGVSVTRAKLTAFAIAGFLAGAQGGLFVLHQQAFTTAEAQASLGIFIAAVVGGLGSALGALLGSLFFWGTFWWLEGAWRLFASAIGVLAVLLIAPGGLAGLVYQARDWLLRQLAVRRGIHVPSMVADDRLAATSGDES